MGDLVVGAFPRAGPSGPAGPRHRGGAPAWSQQRRGWWLLWSGCPGLGWSRLHQLEAAFGSLELAWFVPQGRLIQLPGFGPGLVARIEAFRRRWGSDPWRGGGPPRPACRPVILPGDPAYPQALAQLERPPLGLYWQGRGSLWPQLRHRRAIAVVGTRRPSLHGLSMARALGAALAAAGWPVVSGLAEGIDAAAHRGCLERGGWPVAVVGTPLERVYPRHHGPLQTEVGARGLLLTEQAPGAAVQRGNFAARNRLLVALSQAVVVVECPHGSGALHSADLAWQEGLPLWVVPGDAGKASAAGSNRLLVRGATPLLEPADLISQLGHGPLAAAAAAGCPSPPAAAGSASDQVLLAALGAGASLEQLGGSLGLPVVELSSRLLRLELAGRIRAEPGLCWRPL
ncbi:DNA-protecting protein DprA [Synechococcus sp. Tobar12-5m-g]|uniref:DNA-processing protein DprA n=1 Tax=unclassified Synechococcus TaxID=2626047 RepID=UPI0020CFE89B|nr:MULTISPECIES: DNA-processing protein DprA [unclassified Synechococcus]MCP9773672.1 DNA-protecting protein DprA [Synechococcus sp. Tobar12-5m-g]MCP9874645.1 DNA-protecting protein DprA [Synechococcus sp. Cruz CV-v-12]